MDSPFAASIVDMLPGEAVPPSSEPAGPDGSVSTSGPRAAVLRDPSPSDLLMSLPQPFPVPLASPDDDDLPTPPPHPQPDLGLSFAGEGVSPTLVSLPLPTPPAVKTSHSLRLPSFDLLGIAAPHPDRITQHTVSSFSPLGAGPLSKPEDPLHALSPTLGSGLHPLDGPGEPCAASPPAARVHVEHPVSVVTPPAEPGTLNWGSFVVLKPAALGSPPSSDPGKSPSLSTTASASCPGSSAPIVVPNVSSFSGSFGMEVWVQRIKEILIAESGCSKLDSVKLLTHALPCPSLTGHIFGRIIAALHESTTTNTSWINVFHAVPGRFTLSDLPKSPPSTPGPAVGGDEYFTSKVFDSAVAIPDYQLDSKLLPPSPRPVVPPGSVHISVVERYIPPTNTNEYAEMFLLKGRSLLHDRFVELSPDNGLLVFIYPTKTGARTFMHDYLGPIIDPLLRTLTVVNELPSELSSSLGRMSAVAYLDEYDSLKAELERFCVSIGENAPGGKKHVYTVIHASREEALLERSAWAEDWWIKQEKPRIRETVTKYFRQMKKLPESEMTGTHLIQEVLNGVANRRQEIHDEDGYRPGPKDVEVGVFIVKKTTKST